MLASGPGEELQGYYLAVAEFDPRTPSIARIYDYFVGGYFL
jgi:hypothetical protein